MSSCPEKQWIKGKEIRHAGDFLRLLREPTPDEEKLSVQGAEEVEKEIEVMC